jgi:ankyrin repeat protein
MTNVLRANAVGAVLVAALFWTVAPDSPVADAAERGDVEAVRALVKQGADVNAAQGDGMTALHWAAVNGNAEMAEVLVAAGASTAASTRLGRYTPLHLASERGNAAVVSALLAAGANPNAETSTGAVTPLLFAAGSGDVATITALLNGGADVNRADRQWGHTALMFAAERNRVAAVKVLVERGADPAITGRVIDVAKREREDAQAQIIRDSILQLSPLRQGRAQPVPEPDPKAPAEPWLRPMRESEEVGGYGGMTALTLAAREGNVEATMALLDGGADIDQVDAGQGNSPLLVATLNGWFDLALMLLERGADPNVAAHSGYNPLFAAINIEWAPTSPPPLPAYVLGQKATYLEMMEALLKAGADVNARLRYNIWHIEMGGGTAAQLGLSWMGATPFFRAAHAQDVAAMKLLVRYGADPNIPTYRPVEGRRGRSGEPQTDPSGLPEVPAGGPGLYPIHAATGVSSGNGRQGNAHRGVPNGWLPAVRYLVEEQGADVNARDFNADTPLHNAAFRGDNALILYLVGKGADVIAVNRDGLTTVDKANSPVQRAEPFPETIRLLESMGGKNNHNCLAC